jgi:hypothetical protein
VICALRVVHAVEVVASLGSDDWVGVFLRLEWANVHCGGVEWGRKGGVGWAAECKDMAGRVGMAGVRQAGWGQQVGWAGRGTRLPEWLGNKRMSSFLASACNASLLSHASCNGAQHAITLSLGSSERALANEVASMCLR